MPVTRLTTRGMPKAKASGDREGIPDFGHHVGGSWVSRNMRPRRSFMSCNQEIKVEQSRSAVVKSSVGRTPVAPWNDYSNSGCFGTWRER